MKPGIQQNICNLFLKSMCYGALDLLTSNYRSFSRAFKKIQKKISCMSSVHVWYFQDRSGTFNPMKSIYNCLKSLKLTSDANRYSQLRNMERVLKRSVVPPTPTNLPLPPLSLRRLRR